MRPRQKPLNSVLNHCLPLLNYEVVASLGDPLFNTDLFHVEKLEKVLKKCESRNICNIINYSSRLILYFFTTKLHFVLVFCFCKKHSLIVVVMVIFVQFDFSAHSKASSNSSSKAAFSTRRSSYYSFFPSFYCSFDVHCFYLPPDLPLPMTLGQKPSGH